jgi:hypothetical protein
MSLVSVQEIHDGREGGDEIVSKERSKMTRVRNFRAICSSPYDGPDAVIAAMDPLGTAHPVATNCLLMKRTVKNHAKSKVVFIASQIYSSDPIIASGSPFNDPAEISWTTEQYSRIFQYDTYGAAILNSANEAPTPGVQDSDAYWVASVRKNVTSIPTWLLNFRNSINSSPFRVDGTTVKKWAGWMKAIKIGHVQYRPTTGGSNVAYRALEFTIAIKSGVVLKGANGQPKINVVDPPVGNAAWAGPTTSANDDWWRYLLDEGYNCQYTAGNPNFPDSYNNVMPIRNADGTIKRVKGLLDGTGKLLTGGNNPPNNGSPDKAVFIEWLLKTPQNFNLLPLK